MPRPDVASDAPVHFQQVTRRYRGVTALRDVSLALTPGAVTGLVGRNGSGKTTLLQHISGLLLPSEGRCTTFGVPTDRLGPKELGRIGTMTQHAVLVAWMSVDRLLHYVGGFYDTWDEALVDSLVERLELDRRARVGTLSPGTRQKLAMVLALGHRPSLLLLDEPLSDVDPPSRREMLRILLEVYERDRPTILLSSHLLHDIEPIITHVLCVERGALTAHAELDALKESLAAYRLVLPAGASREALAAPWVLSATDDAGQLTLVVRRDAVAAADLAVQFGTEVANVPLGLEAMFPALIGGRLLDAGAAPTVSAPR